MRRLEPAKMKSSPRQTGLPKHTPERSSPRKWAKRLLLLDER